MHPEKALTQKEELRMLLALILTQKATSLLRQIPVAQLQIKAQPLLTQRVMQQKLMEIILTQRVMELKRMEVPLTRRVKVQKLRPILRMLKEI